MSESENSEILPQYDEERIYGKIEKGVKSVLGLHRQLPYSPLSKVLVFVFDEELGTKFYSYVDIDAEHKDFKGGGLTIFLFLRYLV